MYGHIGERLGVDHHRFSHSKGSRFVEDDDVHLQCEADRQREKERMGRGGGGLTCLVGLLQGIAALDEDTLGSAFSGGHHDGRWSGEPQGARAGDD